jgi:hypothetical protein
MDFSPLKKPPSIITMSEIGGINGYLDVDNATLRAPQIGIANTTPQHALSVGSNLYVSSTSPDVLTVDGNVVCEGVKVGLIEIYPSYGFGDVSNVGNATANTIQFTNATTGFVTTANVEIGGQTTIGGHILPNANGAYDIGSPELAVREIFTSNNSLWIGDRSKISFENGQMKFKRRKIDKVPKVVRELVIANVENIKTNEQVAAAAVAFAQEQFPDDNITELRDLKLQHWRDYTKSIDETKEISDIFVSNDEDYEAQSAADAFKEVGSNIFTTHGVTIGANTEPRAILDITDTGAVIVPVGTTAERPSTAVNGMLRYNSETGYFEAYTVSGWGSLATPPSIASFTPTVVDTSGFSTITLTGSFFDQNSSIKLRGSDGTEYSTTSFSFTSATSISATLPFLPSTKSPYTVVVTAGSGLSTESTDTLTANNNTPVWISPEEGATVSSSSTITLEVTDVDGDTLTYSADPGLPEGLSFDGNTISGTSTETPGSTSTITVRASDGDLYADRTFIIETPLYAFTSHTFTNAGATGRTGPTLTQLTSAYTPTWTDDTNFLNVVTTGIQEWTVPATGTYSIRVGGAEGLTPEQGGDTKSIAPGGLGAELTSNFDLTINQVINIVVGQQPPNVSTRSPGGGGGTFVYTSDNVLLIAAGGGGGGGGDGFDWDYNLKHGTVNNNGNDGYHKSTHAAPISRGGVDGGGGYNGDNSNRGAGGAGWLGDGKDNSYSGSGGHSRTGNPPWVGGVVSNDIYPTSDGGFGGGGASGWHSSHIAYGGGGGGYSGGGGASWNNGSAPAGGGGSYSSQTMLNASSGTNAGNGYVTITKI